MKNSPRFPLYTPFLWKAFIACPVLALAMVWHARAATDRTVLTTATDLTLPASYSGGTFNSGDGVVFANSTYNSPSAFTINSNLSINDLTDNDAGGTSQALTISNNGAAADTLTIGGGINVVAGGSLTLQSGNSQLTTFFNGFETITNAGTLNLAGPVTLGVGGVGGQNKTLTFVGAGTSTVSGATTLVENSALIIGTSTTSGIAVFSGNIGGLGIMTLTNGTATLSGTNSFAGAITEASGFTLNINSAGALGNGGGLSLTSGAIIDNTSGSALTLNTPVTVTLNGNATFTGSSSLNLGAAGNLFAATSGAGTLTLSGAALTVGTLGTSTTVAQTLTVNGSNALNVGTLALNAFNTANGTTYTLAGNAPINVGQVINGSTGAGKLAYSGTNLLSISGASTYTGTTTLSSGVISIGNSLSLGQSSTAALVQSAGTGQLRLNGNNLTLVDLTSTGTGFTIVNNGSGNATLTVNSPNADTYTGSLQNGTGTGTLGLTKLGSGTLTLSGSAASTYTGTTTVNGGTLSLNLNNLSSGSSNLISASSALALGGGTLNVTGQGGAATTQTFASTAINPGASAFTTTQNGATSLTLNLGVISRTAGGTVDFTSLPTTGSITTTSGNGTGILGGWATVLGTNWATSAGTSGTPAAVTAFTAYTATLGTTATGGNSATDNDQTMGTTATNVTGGDLTINSLKLGSTGTLTLTSNLTLNGTNGGLLAVASNTITGAGTLGAGAGNEFIVYDNTNVTTLVRTPIIGSGGGSLTKSGPGTLVLGDSTTNVANAYTGGTTLNAGTLTVGNAAALGTGGVTLNGGTLDLATNTTVNGYNVTVNNNAIILADRQTAGAGITQSLGTLSIGAATLTANKGTNSTSGSPVVAFGATALAALDGTSIFNSGTAGFTFTTVTGAAGGSDIVQLAGGATVGSSITGAISNGSSGGTVGVYQTGAGTWTLGGANTYTGNTLVNAGTMNITGTLGNTAVTVNGATLNLNAAQAISQNALTIGGSATLNESSVNAISGATTLTVISGSANLSLANNYSGSTTVTANGTLTLADANAIASSALTVTGGTLHLRSDTNTTFASASNTFAGTVTIDVDRLTTAGAAGNTLQIGNVSGLGSGGFTANFTNNGGANSYNLGIGAVTTNGVDVNGSILTFNNNMVNGTTTIASVALNGVLREGITFGGTSTTAVTSVGSITGPNVFTSAITQSGAGTLIRTGTDTYVNPTAVSSGTMLVNGTHTGGGAYTVSGTATAAAVLGGTGTINTGGNAINIGNASTTLNNGIITGGTAGTVGMLTLTTTSTGATGGVFFNGTSSFLSTYQADVSSSGTDKLVINGLLNLSGTNDQIVINNTGTLASGNYALVTYSSISGTFDHVSGLTSNETLNYTSASGMGELDLVVAPVPEPATYVGGVLMLGLLGWRHRRQFRLRLNQAV